MKNYIFNIDYTHCPKGHSEWVLIPSSILYPDIFYCFECDCFYSPTVKKKERGEINKEFSNDREQELIDRAKFIKWRDSLSPEDMPDYK
ncbi:MAG: hypothetical protein ACOCQR_03345 [bacterium]